MNKELIQMSKQARMIEGDDTVRAQKCSQEINRILAVYNCEMVPVLTVMGGKWTQEVLVRVKQPEKKAGG